MNSAATPRHVKVSGNVYATATGLKVGARGRVLPAGAFFGGLPKGEARRVRKGLRAAGRAELAGAVRDTGEILLYPTHVYRFDGARSVRVPYDLYVDHKNDPTGTKLVHHVAAPGYGHVTYEVTRVNGAGVWGRVVENRSGVFTSAESA